MVVTDYFDKTFCVNLDHRTDKWETVSSDFILHGLSVERWSAVDGSKVEYSGSLKKGVIGCAMSHRDIITHAKEMSYKKILIFEDDVEFDPNLNDNFNAWYVEVPNDWDMLYLGGNHNVKVITKCTPHLMRATKTQTTHAYAIKNTIYDLILNRLNNIDLDVDVIYMEIQKICNAYCFTPRLAWQRPGMSDIWHQHVDYDFLKTKDGCHR